MISSIALTGRHNIGVRNNKIRTYDGNILDLNEIPFVRYKFKEYTDDDIHYIEENKKIFPCVHIVEITLNKDAKSVLEKIQNLNNIAVMIYIDVSDNEVCNGFSDDTMELLDDILQYQIAKINIRDMSDTLYSLAITNLKKQISEVTGIRAEHIGVCGAPHCFHDGNACLTAIKAREILAEYSEKEDVPLPTSNHEGTLNKIDDNTLVNKCGCIRYYVYDKDIDAPVIKTKSDKISSSTNKPKSKHNVYSEIDW